MNFIPAATIPLPLILSFAAVMVLGVLLSAIYGSNGVRGNGVRASSLKTVETLRADRLEALGSVLMAVGFAGGLLSALIGNLVSAENREERFEAELRETYGIELSDDQLAELQYPKVRPTVDFKPFGSVELVEQAGNSNEYTGTKVYLIWEDGKMILAETTDGESFEAIEPRNR